MSKQETNKLSSEVVEGAEIDALKQHLTELEGRVLVLEEAMAKVRNIAAAMHDDQQPNSKIVAEEVDALTDLLDL